MGELIDELIRVYLNKENKRQTEIIGQAIKEAYRQIEENFLLIYRQQIKLGNRKIKTVGTCGITVVITKKFVVIANAGDS